MHKTPQLPIADAEILANAATDSALTRELVEIAADAGYSIQDYNWAWSGHFNRLGVVRVRYLNQLLSFREVWDIGSLRMPPRSYRRGSQHHRAILYALAFVIQHARLHGQSLNFDSLEKSVSSDNLHDSTLTSESSTTLRNS